MFVTSSDGPLHRVRSSRNRCSGSHIGSLHALVYLRLVHPWGRRREGHHGNGAIPLCTIVFVYRSRRGGVPRGPGEVETQGGFCIPAPLRDERVCDSLALVDSDDDQVERDAL